MRLKVYLCSIWWAVTENVTSHGIEFNVLLLKVQLGCYIISIFFRTLENLKYLAAMWFGTDASGVSISFRWGERVKFSDSQCSEISFSFVASHCLSWVIFTAVCKKHSLTRDHVTLKHYPVSRWNPLKAWLQLLDAYVTFLPPSFSSKCSRCWHM